jgi:hypothetical protein
MVNLKKNYNGFKTFVYSCCSIASCETKGSSEQSTRRTKQLKEILTTYQTPLYLPITELSWLRYKNRKNID